ncbi:MAG: PD40 domain-containing protein [Planctomycetes bacterium]|nr:PD40 domain-containing protein [Planctomycetota bacterium]
MHLRSALACILAAASALAQSGWSSPTLVTELNTTASDTAPHLSIDGTTLHFASYVSGDWEIWSAKRPARGMPFGPATQETALGSTSTDSGPFLAANGLEIVFESLRTGGQGGFDLMRSTRPTESAPWGTPTFITELNSTGSEASASMTADGTEIYLLSTSFGAPYAPNNSIFVARRPNAQTPFSTPALVAELAATQGPSDSHRDVEISADGLRIHFTRYDPTSRRINVYEARRTRRSAPFGTPVLRTEFANVGTSLGVYSITLSFDGSEMFLAAGFPVASGSQELLVSRFEGLSSNGVAATNSTMGLFYRDSTSPFAPYALALSAGNAGFALGTRTVPLDADPIFFSTLAISIPGLSTGFLGLLDGNGESTGTLRNPVAAAAGIHLWCGGFSIDPLFPFNVKTISNSIELELQ